MRAAWVIVYWALVSIPWSNGLGRSVDPLRDEQPRNSDALPLSPWPENVFVSEPVSSRLADRFIRPPSICSDSLCRVETRRADAPAPDETPPDHRTLEFVAHRG